MENSVSLSCLMICCGQNQMKISGKIDLLAIQQKSLDRALFSYIFMHEVRSSGVRASILLCTFEKSTECTDAQKFRPLASAFKRDSRFPATPKRGKPTVL